MLGAGLGVKVKKIINLNPVTHFWLKYFKWELGFFRLKKVHLFLAYDFQNKAKSKLQKGSFVNSFA